MDAFDADVLIYAAQPGHELGRRVLELFADVPGRVGWIAGAGSVLLVPELLMKPLRERRMREASSLRLLLRRLELHVTRRETADLATELRIRYRLRTVDAIHLATAVLAGADRFVTNNRRDFRKSITELDVTYPDDLPEP